MEWWSKRELTVAKEPRVLSGLLVERLERQVGLQEPHQSVKVTLSPVGYFSPKQQALMVRAGSQVACRLLQLQCKLHS